MNHTYTYGTWEQPRLLCSCGYEYPKPKYVPFLQWNGRQIEYAKHIIDITLEGTHISKSENDNMQEIDELCQQGLNSGDPNHWEAALQDILDYVRSAK